MRSRTQLVLLTLFWLLSWSVYAEDLRTHYSDDELITIMQEEGYRAVSRIGEGTIQVKVDGQRYVLFNKFEGDLQAYYGLKGPQLSYEDINQWNLRQRLSRAYLDAEHDPVLEADLLASGGLTSKQVAEFFRVFCDSASSFNEFIQKHELKAHIEQPDKK